MLRRGWGSGFPWFFVSPLSLTSPTGFGVDPFLVMLPVAWGREDGLFSGQTVYVNGWPQSLGLPAAGSLGFS